MGRLLFTILVSLSVLSGFSKEEFAWVYTWVAWARYYEEQNPGELEAIYGDVWKSYEIIIPMPLLTEEYPRAAAQLDKLVKEAMKNHHSLDWALDSLKPTSGPTASVPDSLRGLMLYFIYHDDFSRLEKPWSFKNPAIYFYFSGGTGTYDMGWVRYSLLNVSPSMDGGEELWFYGYCTISWARTDNVIMDSARAVRMFNKAVEKNMLVSRLSKPTWSPILSVHPVVFHNDYKIPAVQIVVPVEYDCCEVYPEVFRRSDTLSVTTFVKDGYGYLISYSNLHPYGENFDEFLEEELVFNP